MKKKIKKISLGLLKTAFAFAALAYVLHKADINEIKGNILHSDPVYLLLAFVCLNIATFLGSLRLKVYFAEEKMNLPESYAIIIYYIGLFFNTVLPGGIGGDGYITLHLRHKYGFPALKIIRILLSTRANGLFFLNLFFFAFVWYSDFAAVLPHVKLAVAVLFVLQMPVYFIAARLILKEKFSTFLKAGLLSLTSQIFSIATAYYAFKACGVADGYLDYLALYMAAAIVAVLPITPGGVGLRELILFKGSEMVGLDTHLAVAGSLTYFAVYFATSLTGLALYLLSNKLKIHHKSNSWETQHGIDGNTAGRDRLES